jgi:cytochrome c1
MPELDADKAGADGGADNKAGTGNAKTDQTADSKGKTTDSDGDKKSPELISMTQDQLNDLVQKRVARATKDADDKAKLSKEQLLERERDEAKNELRVANLRDEFISAAGDIPYAQASKFFRMYRDDLEIDEKTGKATNLKDVLKTAKADWPQVFKPDVKGQGDLGGGSGGTKPVGADMNANIRKLAGRG